MSEDLHLDHTAPPLKRHLLNERNNSDVSLTSDFSEMNIVNGGYEPTSPQDATASTNELKPTKSDLTLSTNQDTYHSIESDISSTAFYSIIAPPSTTGAGSTDSRITPSTLSSRRFNSSNHSNMASFKILSPEEIFRKSNFGVDGGTPTSEERSESLRHKQKYPNGPWTPSSHPSKFMSSSTSNGSSSGVTSDNTSTEKSATSSTIDTRFATSDTKIIMNINTTKEEKTPTRKGSQLRHSILTVNSLNDKNIKLIQKLEQSSQTNISLPRSYSVKTITDVLAEDQSTHIAEVQQVPQPLLISLLKYYINFEPSHGFLGYAAEAIGSIPAPSILLKEKNNKQYPNPVYMSPPGLPVNPDQASFWNKKNEKEQSHHPSCHLSDFLFLTKAYSKIALNYLFSFKGAVITLYFMLVCAFGIFLIILLCDGAPAMSRTWGPDDIKRSPRRLWIEICTQVLTGLFCITGLGLFPLRVRDVFLWVHGRHLGDIYSTNKLLKIHTNWFWAGFSSFWKLFLVIMLLMMSSVFQVLLCVVMWHYDRYTRPTWATASLIGASSFFVIVAGLITMIETRRITSYCRSTGQVRQNGLSFGMSEFHPTSESQTNINV